MQFCQNTIGMVSWPKSLLTPDSIAPTPYPQLTYGVGMQPVIARNCFLNSQYLQSHKVEELVKHDEFCTTVVLS